MSHGDYENLCQVSVEHGSWYANRRKIPSVLTHFQTAAAQHPFQNLSCMIKPNAFISLLDPDSKKITIDALSKEFLSICDGCTTSYCKSL